jgi:hypothetical protein
MGTEELVSTRMTDLCRLAEKYGTDKLGVYTPFYDLLLRDRRAQIFKVLEIGIGTPEAMKHVPNYQPGASLRMWRDYFPYAAIYGIDIDKQSVNNALTERILTFQCDQSSEPELEALVPHLKLSYNRSWQGKFNLIVDDGSHKPEDQLLTFRILSRLLDPHGLYIIEDMTLSPVPMQIGCPYTEIHHWHEGQAGHAIIIRGESFNG